MKEATLVILTLLFVGQCLSQSATGQEHAACKAGNLDDTPPAVIEKMGQFLTDLKAAVAKGNRLPVARMIHYPLGFGTIGSKRTIHTQREFLKEYDQILPAPMRHFILRQETRCIKPGWSEGFCAWPRPSLV